MISRTQTILTLCALTLASPTIAQEVNVYSYREPALIQPLMDAFTAETGVTVNVAFLKKGLIERLRAEGSRSPADLVFTVDISRLHGVVDAGLPRQFKTKHSPKIFLLNLGIPTIIGLASPRVPVLSMPPKTVSPPTR